MQGEEPKLPAVRSIAWLDLWRRCISMFARPSVIVLGGGVDKPRRQHAASVPQGDEPLVDIIAPSRRDNASLPLQNALLTQQLNRRFARDM
jgi:hypothetical protein